jgi:hypothetical protein
MEGQMKISKFVFIAFVLLAAQDACAASFGRVERHLQELS